MPDKQLTRDDFFYILPIPTRWMDNDIYGHVNNVVYYSYFDTVVNSFLIRYAGLDIHNGDVIGFVVKSSCDYMRSVVFPDVLEAGFRVARIGNSSVEYSIGIFKEGDPEICATGSFVHVFVDRETQRPVKLPKAMREALERAIVG